AVSLSFLYSILFSYLGFSIAIGSFIAGISLANLPYNIEIIGRIKPLRDFFSVMFFVSLGMQLVLNTFSLIIKPLIAFILLAVIGKTLITMFAVSSFGYKKRTSFLTAISLAQISEFSLIIAALGLSLGHLSQEIFSLTVLLAIATIILTTYFIKYEEKLYGKLSRPLSFLDKLSRKNMENTDMPISRNYEAILCGYNRIGFSIVKTLKKMKKGILVVDFNPEVARRLSAQNIPSIYGDIGDIEVLERINFKKAKIAISTVPTKADNLLLIDFARKENNKIIILVTASQIQEALDLYDAGADYVVMPHFLGGNYVSVLIEKFDNGLNKLLQHKLQHIKELRERRILGQEHPRHETKEM
ncbi:MAG: NAD-binding protein, partial [Nanoarchaeota archaeon]